MKLFRASNARLIDQRFLAMGTEISVKLVCTHRSRREEALKAIGQVVDLMHEFGHEAWAWGDGALSRFNTALCAGETPEIPSTLRELFEKAWNIRQKSDGLFEPRVAQLVRLWGFDDVARLRERPPQLHEIEQLLRAMSAAPDLNGATHYGPAPDVAWDFGGIGKGYIVDKALDILCQRGFGDAVVDAGGNLAARGSHHMRPWRVAIRDPRSSQEPRRLLASLQVFDEAVITHGDDQRYFEHEGRRYSHILHPKTGVSVQGFRSLTVVHRDATLADAGGAALYVAGPESWRVLARKMGIDQVLIACEDGSIQVTPALAQRISPEPDVRVDLLA
jgi:thiamine biosynthesis lipoprotein